MRLSYMGMGRKPRLHYKITQRAQEVTGSSPRATSALGILRTGQRCIGRAGRRGRGKKFHQHLAPSVTLRIPFSQAQSSPHPSTFTLSEQAEGQREISAFHCKGLRCSSSLNARQAQALGDLVHGSSAVVLQREAPRAFYCF